MTGHVFITYPPQVLHVEMPLFDQCVLFCSIFIILSMRNTVIETRIWLGVSKHHRIWVKGGRARIWVKRGRAWHHRIWFRVSRERRISLRIDTQVKTYWFNDWSTRGRLRVVESRLTRVE